MPGEMRYEPKYTRGGCLFLVGMAILGLLLAIGANLYAARHHPSPKHPSPSTSSTR